MRVVIHPIKLRPIVIIEPKPEPLFPPANPGDNNNGLDVWEPQHVAR